MNEFLAGAGVFAAGTIFGMAIIVVTSNVPMDTLLNRERGA